VERLVPQDAGVVDDDVDRAELVEGRLDDGLAALGGGDAVRVGDGDAAEVVDLLGGLVGRPSSWPSPLTEPPRSLTTMRAPRRASSSACSRPRPPPEPVMIATWPS